MGQRIELHEKLCGIMALFGIPEEQVYFQPPENIKLSYPCLIYKRSIPNVRYADNMPYTRKQRYEGMIIDKDPDTEIPDKIMELPYCSFDKPYTADNLNHYPFQIHY